MIRIQDFDFSNSNPIDSICCGQKSTYLDRATVTFGFGLYTKLSERWSLSGDFGISYGSIRSKTPITSDKWKTWSQAGNAEVNYQLSERGLLRPYVFSGINGIFRKSTFYGTMPLGLGASLMSPNREVMITSQLGYAIGFVNKLSNNVSFSLNVYVRMGGLGKRQKQTLSKIVPQAPIVIRDTIVKKDTIWIKNDPVSPIIHESIGEQSDFSALSDTIKLAIYFNFDSYGLSKNSFEVLNAVVAHLKLNEKVQCVLHGYTDQEGPLEYNQLLSLRRVNTAKNYLASYGIDPNRISINSFGKAKTSYGINETDFAWKNRRVEIFLIK
jgi:peptidoglycan-associated lipoprotein